MPQELVISAYDADDIYDVPLTIEEQGLTTRLMKHLKLESCVEDSGWSEMVARMKSTTDEVKLAIVGKYTNLEDSYLSILEAVKHGGIDNACKVEVNMVEAETLEEDPAEVEKLKQFDGILIPGGFGGRGTEGKMLAIKFARENDIPFLGICLGMQLAVIEFARNVVNLEKANSTEFDEDTPYPVIDILPEQTGVADMGGTMRLGDYDAILKEGSIATKLYETNYIVERHRHRYEVNPEFVDRLESFGMVFFPAKTKIEWRLPRSLTSFSSLHLSSIRSSGQDLEDRLLHLRVSSGQCVNTEKKEKVSRDSNPVEG